MASVQVWLKPCFQHDRMTLLLWTYPRYVNLHNVTAATHPFKYLPMKTVATIQATRGCWWENIQAAGSWAAFKALVLFQLLAVTEKRSHLGLCGPSTFCHCGEKGTFPILRSMACHPTGQRMISLSLCTPSLQVNIGILISVTRIISRISAESYKVHGDANAVKWVPLVMDTALKDVGRIEGEVRPRPSPSHLLMCRLTAKAVAVLLPILGISWIFGVLAVNTHSLPFLYIFAVFNSLQVSSDNTASVWFYSTQRFMFFSFASFSTGILCLPFPLSPELWGEVLFLSPCMCGSKQPCWKTLFVVGLLPSCRSELPSNTKRRCGLSPAAPFATSMSSPSTPTSWVWSMAAFPLHGTSSTPLDSTPLPFWFSTGQPPCAWYIVL